jgi:4,5-epoxidase
MPGRNPEVLVVGAGPVGLFAALALARREVPVRIADTGVWACKHSYALALHPQTLEMFAQYGLREEAVAAAYPVHGIALCDASGVRTKIRMPGEPLAVVRQDFIETLLERKLAELDVQVDWRNDVSRLEPGPDGVTATIDKLEKESRGYIVAHTEWVVAKSTEVEAAYVIGADGYNSRVRRALGYDFPEVGPAAYYAVFEFDTDADLNHEVSIVLGERTTDVLWPLGGGQCRFGFQLPDYHDQQAEAIKDSLLQSGLGYFPTERLKDRLLAGEPGPPVVLDEAALRALLTERVPRFQGNIRGITWRTVVRFERRLASGFGAGRMWLAGDSAHLTGPIGIQSMNVGFFEAADLAASLVAVLGGDREPASLAGYATRWLAVWRQLESLEGGLKAGAGADAWVAAHAGRLMDCLPGHGPELAALAAQAGLHP